MQSNDKNALVRSQRVSSPPGIARDETHTETSYLQVTVQQSVEIDALRLNMSENDAYNGKAVLTLINTDTLMTG